MTATTRLWLRRGVIAALGLAVLLVVLVLWAYATVSLPKDLEDPQSTVILDAKGGHLVDIYKAQNRLDVPLDKVADVMERAVVDTEDRHFYEHGGLDPVGTLRALVNDVRGRHIQGGSTITQQLVKNVYLNSSRTFTRKFKEAILAVKIERQLGKRQILERYLNAVYFGRGAYGIEKASQAYFGVSAAQLTLDQAALLAGLIRAPELADPTTHPAVAMQRRAIVLNAMVRAKHLTKDEAARAKAAPLGALPRTDPKAQLAGTSGYFDAMVEQWAIDKFGERRTLTGGLRIQTTIDPDLQKAADAAIAGVLNQPNDPDAALVSMADDGAVVALIGGRDFQKSQVNLAVDDHRPQAGSTFKPFVLAAALDKDIPPSRHYPGPAKRTIDFRGFKPFPVENFNNESFGSIDLTEATAHSVNTVYAQLAADVGLDAVARTAHELGVDSKFDTVPAMSLGSANVSPMEMLRAYMTFATRGRRVTPYFVQRVTDRGGDVLYESHPKIDDVYAPKYADVVNDILTQVIKRGTGTGANIGRPAAGKTGTTSNNADAWFVGYTPRLGTAVWMGYSQDTSHLMNSVHGREVTGGSFPADIWKRFMTAAVRGRDTGTFTPPDQSIMNGRDTGPTASTTPPSTDTTTSSTTLSSTSSTETSSTLPPSSSTTESPTTTVTTAPPTTTTNPKKSGP